jgi:biotin transporter BioY
MKVLPAIQLLGFVLGAAATGLLKEAWQQGALVGVLTAACVEWWSLRRRLSALDPQASQAVFAAALAGGFLTKLMLLVGLTLVAEFWNLFSAQAFLIAFVATVLWGEIFAVLLLLRSRLSRVSSEDPSTRS